MPWHVAVVHSVLWVSRHIWLCHGLPTLTFALQVYRYLGIRFCMAYAFFSVGKYLGMTWLDYKVCVIYVLCFTAKLFQRTCTTFSHVQPEVCDIFSSTLLVMLGMIFGIFFFFFFKAGPHVT